MTTRKNIMEIDIAKLKRMQMLHVAFVLIDLRSPALFNEGHIDGAFNIPQNEFLNKLPKIVPKKDTPIVVYDENGILAAEAVEVAEKLGYLNIVNLEGGVKGSKS